MKPSANRVGTFSLRADISSVEQSLFGFEGKVAMTVRYSLVDKSGRIKSDKTIKSVYKAQFSEAFAAIERLRRANEGAAPENIGLFLESLECSAQSTGIGAVS